MCANASDRVREGIRAYAAAGLPLPAIVEECGVPANRVWEEARGVAVDPVVQSVYEQLEAIRHADARGDHAAAHAAEDLVLRRVVIEAYNSAALPPTLRYLAELVMAHIRSNAEAPRHCA